ncbi:ATP-binding protein [Pseudarthrobacter sp. BIM B-2242]|uniref:ATP-binding protein n=1 Tax=Pseudarthrobacter sp. BIM B-2242 TaxID=2772401 RepID=UPI00168A8D83|nr:ATP-binding protein [Pseudarthrobacter sp. BIM B-2242]QOD05912.1 ATP-binding protein [Pseudarthrobacter sp. BIM B-2242]
MPPANTTAPSVSTMVRTKLSDGRLLGIGGDMWIVRKLPLEPVADAKSVEERMNVYMPLMAAYEELAAMATTTGNRRSMSRSSYRQHQLLLVNVAKLYNPSGHKIAGFLKESFPTQVTEKRIALLAVRLVAKVGSNGGWQKALDSVVETLVSGGTPLSDFDDDYRKVDAALARSGLSTPTAQELSMANSWWNQGEFPDTVDLPHSDHLHIFADTKAVRMANDAGREDCTKWPRIPKHRSLTFATLEDFNFEFESSESTAAHWATGLVEDGAVAISIRGSIEPAKVTRAELRRQRKRYMDDINERHKNNKMEDARQEEMLATLEAVENVYANGGSPTLVDASVLVAFDGEIEDITQAGPRSAANLRIMNFRQRQALAEMMLCSGVRANPNLHDLPIQTVACSGIQSLSTVGDKDGALLGFTERDSQPAYESPTAASSGDAAPIFVNLGATGSGKTMVLLWKAIQFAKLGGPQVIIDPKTGSDHSPTVLGHGGQVASLDDLKEADGIFDPLRFSHNPTVGVELAVSMLASIDPWGGKAREFEVHLYTALSYGVSKGATCVGQALLIAKEDGKATPALVDPIFDLANTSPLFRACVGVDPHTKALSINEGITLIKVGNTHLDLPEPGAMASASVMQKVSLALVRMMVFGSAMALTGRGGAIHLDEAWVFLGAGKAEVERLGRLARSQQVLPELYTQRASDPLKAGLAGYISRGLILPIEDKDEARAALELFKLQATDERLNRITGKAMLGEGGTVAPNWSSMRALRDPVSKKVLRGTVGYYSDLAGRCVPVQIVLPPAFLKLASTNADDLNERKQELLLAAV